MTLKEQKFKVLSMIEELNPESEYLTDDPDISSKINAVFNQVQNELARIKKIPAKYEFDATESKILSLKDIPELYQLSGVSTPKYELIGNMELKFDDDVEQVTIYYFKYPTPIQVIIEDEGRMTAEEISQEIDETYEFELDNDVLEVMPYGVAADILKNDMISNYGRYYYERYNEMKQYINPNITSVFAVAEGGLDF